MLAYLDSSILLRVLFREASQLSQFADITDAVSSDLLRVECLRTLDRIRIEKRLTEDSYLAKVEALYPFLERMELIPIGREILNRASQPFPTKLGSLDAIHLASAILYRERKGPLLQLCTHDRALARAALANGFKVHGVDAS